MPNNSEIDNNYCEKFDRHEFVDILKKMLAMDQEQRLTPTEGLQHRFIQMPHLLEHVNVQ